MVAFLKTKGAHTVCSTSLRQSAWRVSTSMALCTVSWSKMSSRMTFMAETAASVAMVLS
jgi:hypothetical protein